MKRLLVLIWIFGLSNAFAQKPVLMSTVSVTAEIFIGYDALGAYYTLSSNVLTKQFGEQKWEYKNPQLCKIAKVDLQNPLKIVLFYQDFNTIILLDNQLNETTKINLSDSTNPIVPIGVGLASGNRLWIYNNLTMKVGLYDYSKQELKSLTIPFSNNVANYSSDFNFFQWVDELGNAYRCDVYGKIKTLGVVPQKEQMLWISDSVLIYKKENLLFTYNMEEKKSTLIEIDEKTFKNFTFKDQILSIFTDHGITNYKIAVP
jgi:hypothetical protein